MEQQQQQKLFNAIRDAQNSKTRVKYKMHINKYTKLSGKMKCNSILASETADLFKIATCLQMLHLSFFSGFSSFFFSHFALLLDVVVPNSFFIFIAEMRYERFI